MIIINILGNLGDMLGALGPHGAEGGVLGVPEEALEVLEQRVPVLLDEAYQTSHVKRKAQRIRLIFP